MVGDLSGPAPRLVPAATVYWAHKAIYSLDNPLTVTNSVADTDLYRVTVPGGVWLPGRELQARFYGALVNNTGVTRTPTGFRLKYGGTTILDGVHDAGTNTLDLDLWFFVWGFSNATNSQIWRGWNSMALPQDTDLNSMVNEKRTTIGVNTSAIDAMSPQDLVFSIQLSFAATTYTAKVFGVKAYIVG